MKNIKKVLYLSPLPPPTGGIATWTNRILSLKLPLNWQSGVVNTKITGQRASLTGKKSLNGEIKRTIKIYDDTRKKLRDKSYRVVHLNCSGSFTGILRDILILSYVKLKRRKIVVHFRCTIPNIIIKFHHKIACNILIKISDKVILLNQKSYDSLSCSQKEKSRIIENFLDNKNWNNMNKRFNDCKLSKAIYVGLCIKEKGCVEIFNVAKKMPEIDFTLIGHVSKEIESLYKPKNLKLLGEQEYDQIINALSESDVFIFPSYFKGEGFANALLEAMASGLPCIATDWAANADMIEGKGGFIVPIKNHQKIIESLNLLKDNKLRMKMGNWNLNKVKNNYLEDIIIKKYIDVYEELL